MSRYIKDLGAYSYEDAVKYMNDESPLLVVDSSGEEIEVREPNAKLFLREHDVYISLIYLRAVIMKEKGISKSQREFNDCFKKIYPGAAYLSCAHRELYVKARLIGDKVRFIDG